MVSYGLTYALLWLHNVILRQGYLIPKKELKNNYPITEYVYNQFTAETHLFFIN